MLADNDTAADTDRDIVTTRLFDAPRPLVFEAWTSPEHLAAWWGPHGFRITTERHDFRPGGTWKLTMHGPDGTDYPSAHVFEEIIPNERIVYTHRGRDGDLVSFRSTITFEDEGGKTRLTMRQVFGSRAERDAIIRQYNVREGARQTLDRLGAHVAALPRATEPKKKPELHIRRTFDAPRALVFEAWTKADHLSKWFTPRPLTTSACEVDFRPGGVFRLTMRMPDGVEHPMDARFGDIVVPERIVFFAKIHGDLDVETSVTFTESAEKTTVEVHQIFAFESPATLGAPQGWTATLDQLGEHVRAS